jgi:hypothetical protein
MEPRGRLHLSDFVSQRSASAQTKGGPHNKPCHLGRVHGCVPYSFLETSPAIATSCWAVRRRGGRLCCWGIATVAKSLGLRLANWTPKREVRFCSALPTNPRHWHVSGFMSTFSLVVCSDYQESFNSIAALEPLRSLIETDQGIGIP